MVAQSVSVLDRLTGSPVGFVCFVCSCMLALIVLATVFSGKFRTDLLAGSGQATLFGLFSVTGATVLAFVALLIGGGVITGKQASDVVALTSENSKLRAAEQEWGRERQKLIDHYNKILTDAGLITPIGEPVALERVTIDVNTKGSRKAHGETVCFEVEHDGVVLAHETCGRDQEWPRGELRSQDLSLSRSVPMDQCENIIIRVKKQATQSRTGRRWDVQFDASGELSNNTRVALLTTPEITIGGRYDANQREFIPTRYERVVLTPRPLFRTIFVNDKRVAAGHVSPSDGLTSAPVRTIAEALGATVHDKPADAEVRIYVQ